MVSCNEGVVLGRAPASSYQFFCWQARAPIPDLPARPSTDTTDDMPYE
jgi:hypothetical protein